MADDVRMLAMETGLFSDTQKIEMLHRILFYINESFS